MRKGAAVNRWQTDDDIGNGPPTVRCESDTQPCPVFNEEQIERAKRQAKATAKAIRQEFNDRGDDLIHGHALQVVGFLLGCSGWEGLLDWLHEDTDAASDSVFRLYSKYTGILENEGDK